MARRPRWKRRRPQGTRLRRVVAVNLALIVAVLIAAEIAFGGWVFKRNYGILVIPREVTRHYIVDRLYGGRETVYRRDEHGLRGDYGEPSDIDLLAIGGSTTNEIFITEGRTWVDLLGRYLRDAGRDIVTANAGVDGQSTVGHLKNFELWFPMIPGLRPRYMLAYIGVNDNAIALNSGYLGKQDAMEEARRPFRQYLLNNSALYQAYRNIRGILRARDARLIHTQESLADVRWTELPEPPDMIGAEARYAADLDAYGERVRDLIGRIRAIGAEAIIVSQPRAGYRLRDGRVYGRLMADGRVDDGYYPSMVAFNRRTIAVCREVGAICLDLAAELQFGDGDNYDPIHTTPQGSDKIARYLADKLKDVVR